MNGITVLPDGSGFFTGTVGERELGFINWLKYRKIGCARRWLFVLRMFKTAREPYYQLTFMQAIRAALRHP